MTAPEGTTPEITADAPCRILFVDDEENILRSLRRLFMGDEYEVYTASSGQEALKILEEVNDVAVIVSDQRMPGMSGVDFLERSRKITPQSIRILLTGYADIQAAMDAINRGGTYRYLTKPWQDEDLVQTVRAAYHNYRLIQENRRLNALVRKQNEELKKWSQELEIIVQEQTMELQRNYDQLRELNARLRRSFKSSMAAFANLLELRDKKMRSHSRNVAEICAKVADSLGMEEQERESLLAAALLHDIGKIGIPDVMLRVEPEDLNQDELDEYRKHPVRGQAALATIEDLKEAGTLIRHHHEHYDGSGFPDGVKRKEIPLGSRIIAMADFVDRHVRRFQGDAGVSLTMKKLEEEAGKRFDPRLVEPVTKVAREFYRDRLPKAEFTEMELSPKDLAEGMVVSRDVFSGTGLLLLSRGTVLNGSNISLLRRYHQMDPSRRGIFVMVKD